MTTSTSKMLTCLALLAWPLLAATTACTNEAVGDGRPSEAEAKAIADQDQALFRAGCTSTVCRNAGRAGCWTSDVTKACQSCENTFGQTNALALWGGCSTESGAYGTCLRSSEFTCGDAGVAVPVGCDETRAALEKCLKGDAGAL